MKKTVCVLEPCGLADAPELIVALARTREMSTRSPAVVFDADTTGRLADLGRSLPALTRTMVDWLEAIAKEKPLPAEPVRGRGPWLVPCGATLELAWARVVEAAVRSGLALPFRDLMTRAWASPGPRGARLVLAPPGMGSLQAALVNATDACVVVARADVDVEALTAAFRWLDDVAALGAEEPPVVIVAVGAVREGPRARAREAAMAASWVEAPTLVRWMGGDADGIAQAVWDAIDRLG